MNKAKLLLFLLFPLNFYGQINLTSGTTYTETFGAGLVSSWTDNSTFPGWYLAAGGTFNFVATTNITSAAPPNTGGFYTYKCNGVNDLKLGSRPSNGSGGTAGTGVSYMGMRLKNTTGATITGLSVSFEAFQLSKAENDCNINSLTFSYRVGTSLTSLTTGTWTDVPALDYTAPNNDCSGGTSTQLIGYPCTVSSNLSACISVSIPANSEIVLRWGDINNQANDPHLAIDNIAVTPVQALTVTASGPTTFCQGDSVTLTAAGTGTYSWNTGATTPSIVASAAGTYTVTSTTACGIQSATASVTVNPLPAAVITPSGTTSLCAGESVTLNASGGNNYSWSTGSTSSSITVSTAGTYTVTSSNSCGSQTATQTVTTTTSPSVTIHANSTSFCPGSSLLLYATGNGSFLWTGGSSNDSIQVSSAGSYTVTATSSCGTATDNITITQLALPVASITPSGSTALCPGNSVILNASGGTSYSWSPSGSTSSTLTASAPGTYSVTAANSCGTDIASITLTALASPVAVITPSGTTSICSGNSATLNATGGDTYTWSNGQTGNTISPSTEGNYWVIASNACGNDSASVFVNVDSVEAFFSASPVTGLYPLSVNFTNNSSASANNFIWNFGNNSTSSAVSPSNTYQDPGTYVATLTAVNALGCTDVYSVTIVVLGDASSLQMPNVFTPNGDGINDQFKATGSEISEFECKIFDRWGIPMAEINSVSTGWDGRTSGGSSASDGTYFYILKAKGTDGKEYNDTGCLQLISK